MIIYPNNITNINKTPLTTNNANLLEEYFQTKYDILHFDTEEGIFEIASNKIYKITTNPDLEHYPFSNEISFMIQNQDTIRTELYYIPIHYTYVKKELKKYKLHPTSLLTIVLVNNSEIYFETAEGEITESIKEDMITFLSLLKLYK
tara:strand:- start:957 stop:1397 length:441 start_codon:yes stop_codon:yes gene_type:complete